MQLENILWRVEDGVGVATVHRPQAMNALNARTLADLAAVVDAVAADRSIRALVLTGAGEKAFVAGADITQFTTMSPLDARRFGEDGQRTLARLAALPVPTIAAVNGFALGGGCELAMACDLVYASEKARFGQPEVNLGIIPGFGGTQRLARRVGLMRAKELVLTGAMVDAHKAKEIGLALEVLAPDRLLPHCLEVAKAIAARAPLATAAAKRVLEAGADLELGTACRLELEAFALLFSSADAREGARAFVEKRPAQWKGS